MDSPSIAKTPSPPYFSVIFTSRRSGADPEYDATAARMIELARDQPGFLGIESARNEGGLGVTVSYWESEESIRAWKSNSEHQVAQERGKTEWYAAYRLRVAKVTREYGTKDY